jgi:hypothetical protein
VSDASIRETLERNARAVALPPGYKEVRCIVTVASPAPAADVQRVIDTADRYSPYRDVFARAQDVRRELRIQATT